MALTNNPNKTKSIEKRWNREINNRWAQFWLAVTKIPLSAMVINIDDQEQSKIDEFLFLFALLANQMLLAGPEDKGEWQNKYQTTVYGRSAERTVNEVKPLLTQSEINSLIFFAAIGNLVTIPANRNELNFLHNRANESLTKWVQALISDTNSIIHDNFGKINKNDLMELIKSRVDVTASRARMIATTEITQAAQRAATVQANEISKAIGKDVGVRWITVRDAKVRHLHAGWHGKIFTTEQAEKNMNISPWNCRCGLKAVVKVNRSSKARVRLNARFERERKFLLAKQTKDLAKNAN